MLNGAPAAMCYSWLDFMGLHHVGPGHASKQAQQPSCAMCQGLQSMCHISAARADAGN